MDTPIPSRDGDEIYGPTRDGSGAGDHNSPFEFGQLLTTRFHPLFTDLAFARLLCLRSHVFDGDRAFKTPPTITAPVE